MLLVAFSDAAVSESDPWAGSTRRFLDLLDERDRRRRFGMMTAESAL